MLSAAAEPIKPRNARSLTMPIPHRNTDNPACNGVRTVPKAEPGETPVAIQLLTTGKVAQRCSVKPDTVLKWIKKGQLPASRTVGGHYRVDERDLAPLVGEPEVHSTGELVSSPCIRQPLRCWEYLSDSVHETCKNCVTYRVRAAWCFQLVKVMHAAGHTRRFCTGACVECPYYRRAHALPTQVLVITRDEPLIQSIARRTSECIAFRFGRTGYDASAIVSVFRPALVIVDEHLVTNEEAGLIEALATDQRVPGTRILVGVRRDSQFRPAAGGAIAGTIQEPFRCDDLLAWAERGPVEALTEESRRTAG